MPLYSSLIVIKPSSNVLLTGETTNKNLIKSNHIKVWINAI